MFVRQRGGFSLTVDRLRGCNHTGLCDSVSCWPALIIHRISAQVSQRMNQSTSETRGKPIWPWGPTLNTTENGAWGPQRISMGRCSCGSFFPRRSTNLQHGGPFCTSTPLLPRRRGTAQSGLGSESAWEGKDELNANDR